ncbi:hypothetical protein SSX86_012530 [Deinandra increscens subsp. villosa]|uniref:Uncharacterized protein n=1 Tax=Deinandra increscens subsp. villosa TaxID=3103831 RepID=A0AAP0D9J9_9ASTR
MAFFRWWWQRSEIWKVVSVLLLGQLMSFILALQNLTSSLSADLVNSAYYFTSITSVALLDSWAVAWAILFTWLFLGTTYSLWQLLGATICGLGLCLVVLSDAGVGGGGGSNPLLGDILVIGATLFYALSNVGQGEESQSFTRTRKWDPQPTIPSGSRTSSVVDFAGLLGSYIASNHHDHSAGADEPYVCDWKTEVGWSLCNLKLYGFGKLLQGIS